MELVLRVNGESPAAGRSLREKGWVFIWEVSFASKRRDVKGCALARVACGGVARDWQVGVWRRDGPRRGAGRELCVQVAGSGQRCGVLGARGGGGCGVRTKETKRHETEFGCVMWFGGRAKRSKTDNVELSNIGTIWAVDPILNGIDLKYPNKFALLIVV